MKNVFHMSMMNLRNTAIKAYVPRGKESLTMSHGIHKSPNEKLWRVVSDPSNTLNIIGATFGKMDLDVGARFGAWAKGTAFQNVSSGKFYYFDHMRLKIRRMKVNTQYPKPTVVMPDYSKHITVNGQAATFVHCPHCQTTTPHQNLGNGKQICGFCGTEH